MKRTKISVEIKSVVLLVCTLFIFINLNYLIQEKMDSRVLFRCKATPIFVLTFSFFCVKTKEQNNSILIVKCCSCYKLSASTNVTIKTQISLKTRLKKTFSKPKRRQTFNSNNRSGEYRMPLGIPLLFYYEATGVYWEQAINKTLEYQYLHLEAELN